MDSNFYFLGEAPASKSLFNRSLIVKSYFDFFHIKGSNSCDDVQIMKSAVNNLKSKKEFYCGLSGTAFRFLSVRLSREKGEFFLEGEPALMRRPLHEATSLLSQLSVETCFMKKGLKIVSEGWKPQGDSIHVPSQITSQWASALLLNGWNLEKDLYFSFSNQGVSFPYFKMTLDFIKSLGLKVISSEREYKILSNQKLKKKEYFIEQDQSCLFILSALAVLKGKAIFTNWESKSIQPDSIFLEVLKQMGVTVEYKNKNLEINQCPQLKPISINLKSYPDLFPVLSVLCSQAEGTSVISGLSHLAFKESHRLKKIEELLSFSGVDCFQKKDIFYIKGGSQKLRTQPFSFDCDQDHRMVMSAGLLKKIGVPLVIHNKEAVNKSFPDFFRIIEEV